MPLVVVVIIEGHVVVGQPVGHRVGPLPVVHHLRHGRSHATRIALLAAQVRFRSLVGRHLIPIGCGLIPVRLDERFHSHALGTARVLHRRCALSIQRGGLFAVTEVPAVTECGNGLVILLQPRTHVLGHLFPVDASRCAVAQHGQGALVGRGDDVSPAVHIERIDFRCLRCGWRKFLASLESRCRHSSGVA